MKDEAPPKAGGEAVVPQARERFLEASRHQEAKGLRRYGMPLTVDNGRDHLNDAWQELADLAHYLGAAEMRQRALQEENAALRKALGREEGHEEVSAMGGLGAGGDRAVLAGGQQRTPGGAACAGAGGTGDLHGGVPTGTHPLAPAVSPGDADVRERNAVLAGAVHPGGTQMSTPKSEDTNPYDLDSVAQAQRLSHQEKREALQRATRAKASGLVAENAALREALEDRQATIDLYNKCLRRGSKLWRAAHPQHPLMWPDGAEALVTLVEHLDAERKAMRAEARALQAQVEQIASWNADLLIALDSAIERRSEGAG
jgi:hypothetical protein